MQNSVNLKQIANGIVWLAAFLRAYVYLCGKVQNPMCKTAVLYGFACLFNIFIVHAAFINGINAILFGMIFAYIFKKAKAVVGSLYTVVAYKPQIFSETLLNKCDRQCENKQENMKYILRLYIFEFFKKS